MNYPLFWCLKAADQAKLMQYQYDEYGFKLSIPPEPSDIHIDTEIEDIEEIDRLMRSPTRFKRQPK